MSNQSKLSITPLLVFITILLFGFFVKNPQPVFSQFTPQCFYNACSAGTGPICDLGCQYYSPGDYIYDSNMNFYTSELKYVPHPYWMEYRDFTCRMEDCAVAPTEYWFCASEIDGEDPAIRICNNLPPAPGCFLTSANCSRSASDAANDIHCEINSVRWCDDPYYGPGYYTCTGSGWNFSGGSASGDCWPTEYWVRQCTDGAFDSLNSGTWVNVPRDTPEQGRCEDMLDSYTVGFSPGSVQTSTPYLFRIWSNIVAKTQNIFTPFRTDFTPPEDWPGDTTITYSFVPTQGEGWADAGSPDSMHPGYDARIYFRYLGYIHCAKENLLHKLTSLINTDQPYVYYDSRCETGSGGSTSPIGDETISINCTDDFETIYNGVTYKHQTVSSPRTLSVHIVKVDFGAPGTDLFITPEAGLGTTTSTFLQNYGLQVAINGDVTDPSDGGPMGLAASDGIIYNTVTPHEIVAYGSDSNQITMYDEPGTIYNAISGQNALVQDGAMHPRIASCAEPENYCSALQPRTAIGVTSGNTLIMIVIDGRQAGLSLGTTLHEMAEMMLQCSAQDAFNLDGGGSTTLVIQGRGVVNSPSEGSERSIPNHLGIRAQNP